MAFARDNKENATTIGNDGKVTVSQVGLGIGAVSPSVDLDDKPMDVKEALENAKAMATKVALRAMENARKGRPTAASSSAALESKEKANEAKVKAEDTAHSQAQLEAYNEPPIPIPQSKNETTLKLSYKDFHHDPKTEHEAMKILLGHGPSGVILECVGEDFKTDGPEPEDTKTEKFSLEKRQQFTLFGVHAPALLKSLAEKVATLILNGEEKEIEEALAIVKKHPDVLRCQVIAKDRLGRRVQGTPLQIAAMAGDVDIQADIKEEKNRGAVERLILAGDLTPAEITEQLKVVMSEEAKQANEKRNQRVLNAIKKFGEGIIRIAAEYVGDKNYFSNFQFQVLCKPIIKQLEKDITPDSNEIITSGTIFDPNILNQAIDWFEYGYDLCLMSKEAKNDTKLEQGRLYLREEKGCILYSVMTPDGKEARDVKINALKAPQPFNLDELNKLKAKIFQTTCAAPAHHTIKNLDRFGGWWGIQGNVFGVNGYGLLQTKLSARDGHVARHGIGSVVENYAIPLRTLNNSDGTCYFDSSSSGLGLNFYLGYLGQGELRWSVGNGRLGKTYAEQKQQSYARLCSIRKSAKEESMHNNVAANGSCSKSL